MSNRSIQSTKWKYTFKLLAGLIFFIVVLVLLYWLLFIYRVRNFLALAVILIFLVIPSIRSILTLPNEFRALKLIWQSDDPEALDKVLGDLREKGML